MGQEEEGGESPRALIHAGALWFWNGGRQSKQRETLASGTMRTNPRCEGKFMTKWRNSEKIGLSGGPE